MNKGPNRPENDPLDALLRRLPDKPVPSNFTARVMEQIGRDVARPVPSRAMRWNLWLHKFLPRTAVAAVVLSAGLFAAHVSRVHQRSELAQTVVTVSKVDPLTDPDVMANFDTIHRMSQQSTADDEILALMQ